MLCYIQIVVSRMGAFMCSYEFEQIETIMKYFIVKTLNLTLNNFTVAYPHYIHFVLFYEKFVSTLTWGSGGYLFRETPLEANVCGFVHKVLDCSSSELNRR